MTPYPRDVEQTMRSFFQSLRENDRRRYAAVEAAKLGHGGIEYISAVLGIDPKTIRQGQRDLEDLPERPTARVRKTGGGRKRRLEQDPKIDEDFQQGPGRSHRRQSHPRVADLDQPDQDRDRRSDARVWQLCQCAYRRSIARPVRLSRTEGPEDAAAEPPSRSQQPIRDDRPAQARVPRFRRPDPEHGPEIAGTARQFLPRRHALHARDDPGVRPRLRRVRPGGGAAPRDLRPEAEPRIHPPRHKS